MPRFMINNAQYHVDIKGTGTPILLLHGFTGSAVNWTAIRTPLQNHTQVIAVDLLGHGQTDAPAQPGRYQMANAAVDLIALITILGLESVHLLGYSMGARLALYIACYYPDRIASLTLESGSPGLLTEAERQARRISDEALANSIEHDGILMFVDYWEAQPLFASQQRLSESIREALRQQRLSNNPHGLANSLRGMGTGVQLSLWEMLGQITVPTLLFSGALDVKFTEIARKIHTRIASSTLITVADVGHAIHLERPTAIIDPLMSLLNI